MTGSKIPCILAYTMSRKRSVTVVVGLLCIAGLSIFFAVSDSGQINVSQEIQNSNDANPASETRVDTRATLPNGGLNPRGASAPPQEQIAPEEAVSAEAEQPTADAEESASTEPDGGPSDDPSQE